MSATPSDIPHSSRRSNKSGKSGRPFLAHRLPGVDLRSETGRRYTRHYRALEEQFPGLDTAEIRALATLQAHLEQAQGALLTESDPWKLAKIRADVLQTMRLVDRRLAELRARCDPPAPHSPADGPPSLAEVLAKHAEAVE